MPWLIIQKRSFNGQLFRIEKVKGFDSKLLTGYSEILIFSKSFCLKREQSGQKKLQI